MITRRLLAVAACTVLLAAPAVRGAPRPIRLVVDGRELRPEAPPIMVENRVLVPLRFVAEALDCDVFWDEDAWTVEVRRRPRPPWVDPRVHRTGALTVLPAGYRRAGALVPRRNPTLATLAPAGQAFLVLELMLVNSGTAGRKVNPHHVFTLEAGGYRYEPHFGAMAFSLEEPLEGEVQPGGVLQGEVAFLVPAATTRAVLWVRGLGRDDLEFQLVLD